MKLKFKLLIATALFAISCQREIDERNSYFPPLNPINWIPMLAIGFPFY
ncbi:MAG: hypothetical protein NBV77_04830 [Bacteroidia bacterium]|nr:hypothetical protein [Bacteroidia bacterium]